MNRIFCSSRTGLAVVGPRGEKIGDKILEKADLIATCNPTRDISSNIYSFYYGLNQLPDDSSESDDEEIETSLIQSRDTMTTVTTCTGTSVSIENVCALLNNLGYIRNRRKMSLRKSYIIEDLRSKFVEIFAKEPPRHSIVSMLENDDFWRDFKVYHRRNLKPNIIELIESYIYQDNGTERSTKKEMRVRKRAMARDEVLHYDFSFTSLYFEDSGLKPASKNETKAVKETTTEDSMLQPASKNITKILKDNPEISSSFERSTETFTEEATHETSTTVNSLESDKEESFVQNFHGKSEFSAIVEEKDLTENYDNANMSSSHSAESVVENLSESEEDLAGDNRYVIQDPLQGVGEIPDDVIGKNEGGSRSKEDLAGDNRCVIQDPLQGVGEKSDDVICKNEGGSRSKEDPAGDNRFVIQDPLQGVGEKSDDVICKNEGRCRSNHGTVKCLESSSKECKKQVHNNLVKNPQNSGQNLTTKTGTKERGKGTLTEVTRTGFPKKSRTINRCTFNQTSESYSLSINKKSLRGRQRKCSTVLSPKIITSPGQRIMGKTKETRETFLSKDSHVDNTIKHINNVKKEGKVPGTKNKDSNKKKPPSVYHFSIKNGNKSVGMSKRANFPIEKSSNILNINTKNTKNSKIIQGTRQLVSREGRKIPASE